MAKPEKKAKNVTEENKATEAATTEEPVKKKRKGRQPGSTVTRKPVAIPIDTVELVADWTKFVRSVMQVTPLSYRSVGEKQLEILVKFADGSELWVGSSLRRCIEAAVARAAGDDEIIDDEEDDATDDEIIDDEEDDATEE